MHFMIFSKRVKHEDEWKPRQPKPQKSRGKKKQEVRDLLRQYSR